MGCESGKWWKGVLVTFLSFSTYHPILELSSGSSESSLREEKKENNTYHEGSGAKNPLLCGLGSK